ncbi:transposase, IS21 family (istA-like) protein [Stappia sp. 22II-S9-Z10]|nr:transposase, IS21 family (istA-like) protein [Stappia sp. 22II-S9-Z10]
MCSNARVHATTKAVPAERLAVERPMLQPISVPYSDEIVRSDPRPAPVPIVGLQHPLSIYDELMLPGAARSTLCSTSASPTFAPSFG